MKKQKQYSFIKAPQKFFGGALLKGKRKSFRPLSSKDTIHFVLRSEWATGKYSFLASRNKRPIELILEKFSRKFGVKIYRQAIVSNHIHLLLMITNRHLYRAFIKAVSGLIASHVMRTKTFKCFVECRREEKPGDAPKGLQTSEKDQKESEGFWQHRPFSRVVQWGRDFTRCVSYLNQNMLEALGFTPYKVRKDIYAKWLLATAPNFSSA